MLTTKDHRLLTTLDALLELGHVEPARCIIAEAQGGRFEDPDVDPLTVIDDSSFETLQRRIEAEAFRRERLIQPHVGDRWCKQAKSVVVGDVVCFPHHPSRQPYSWEREVRSIDVDDRGWLRFEFTDGIDQVCQRRPGDLMVVKKRPEEMVPPDDGR